MSFEKDEGFSLQGKQYHGDVVLCSLCDTQMRPGEEDPNILECPKCHRTYIITREVLEHEDEMVSAHEDENVELGGLDSGIGISTEKDDDVFKPRLVGPETKLRLRPDEHVLSYEEEIPDPT